MKRPWLYYLLYALIIVVLGLFTFGKLPFTFFQQDEWAIFGNYLYWQKAHLNWFERLFYGQYTHFIPLSNLFSFTQFKLFGVEFYPYAISSILLHLLNSFLVFYLGWLLFKKRILASIAGFLFLINSISHQAVTWIATAPGTQGSVFFVLLCLILFTKYMFDKSGGRRYFYFSLLFLITSLFFKETSVFIFLFLPLYGLIMKSNKSKKIAVYLIVLGVVYASLRAIIPIIEAQPAPAILELTQPDFLVYLYRAFVMPLRVLAQSIVPVEYIIKASNFFIKTAYPQFVAIDNAPNPYIVESIGADVVSFGIAAVLLIGALGLFIYFKKDKKEQNARILILSITAVGLSSLPFIFVPGKAGFLSLLDSRHFYLTGIFTSVLISNVLFGLYEIFNRKRIILLILIFIFSILSVSHISKIRSDISKQIAVSHLRQSILGDILSKYPTLPKRVVFYIPSDSLFYGVGENILPFQSGFGQTLLVWYDMHGENFPACFFKDQFLYVLLSVGYRECEGRGFGYFRKLENLKVTVEENNLPVESIIGLRYNSSTHQLSDITDEVVLLLK